MPLEKRYAAGLDALNLSTTLQQRIRLADPVAGVFEAADMQWSWRKPRLSDEVQMVFWMDGAGPVSGVYLTSAGDGSWQIDPMILPGIDPEPVWQTALALGERFSPAGFDVPISDDDEVLVELAQKSGLQPGDSDSTGWLSSWPPENSAPLAEGFTLIDRASCVLDPHPMQELNGPELAGRLAQTSLYDPSLDLAVLAADGAVAAYSLYWFDPVTRVGLVEPVRTDDAYQRKGLARAMVSNGCQRLVEKGAARIKVSWETEAAGALYQKIGFVPQSTSNWYQWKPR